MLFTSLSISKAATAAAADNTHKSYNYSRNQRTLRLKSGEKPNLGLNINGNGIDIGSSNMNGNGNGNYRYYNDRRSDPTIRLSSGEKPNLGLAGTIGASTTIVDATTSSTSSSSSPSSTSTSNCEYHALFSHTWKTGQAKSHAIVRRMQLVMPQIRIWLDVDEIHQESGGSGTTGSMNLEVAVEKSAVLILFYSKGYFASRNCRREIYTALKLDKPIICIYEGNQCELKYMRDECIKYCSKDLEPRLLSNMLHHLDQHTAIPWVNEDIFAAKALNKICTTLLSYLPYYQRYPQALEGGVYVPGELGHVELNSPVTILVYRGNEGSLKIVSQAKKLLEDTSSTRSSTSSGTSSCRTRSVDGDGGGDNATGGTSSSSQLSFIEPIADAEELEGLICFPGGRSTSGSSGSQRRTSTSDLTHHPNSNVPLSSSTPSTEQNKHVLILYLNKEIFGDEDESEELTILLKRAIELNIEIILLHERDLQLGGCEFDDFFETTPRVLLDEPYNIYSRTVAVPLHSDSDYRELGLKRLLCKLGAEEVKMNVGHRILQKFRAKYDFIEKKLLLYQYMMSILK